MAEKGNPSQNAMELIMTLENRVRELKAQNKELKRCVMWAMTYAKPIAFGVGTGVGALIGWLLRAWLVRGM